MRTTPKCISCLRRQAHNTIGLATDNPTKLRQAKEKVEVYLEALAPTLSPPENASGLYALIARHTDCPDPYAHIKREENILALQLREQVKTRITESSDPLLTAIKYTAAGNIIDHGANHDFDQQKAMTDYQTHPFAINDLKGFRHELERARTILYLADNCGEIVLDGLLAERLSPGKEVVVAVRGGPVINDATLADAHFCGLTKTLQVISNGCTCPGTPLAQCSQEFRNYFQTADLIISKGQGNFETLTATKAPLYFLLTVKCQEVAHCLSSRTTAHTNIGDLVLHRARF